MHGREHSRRHTLRCVGNVDARVGKLFNIAQVGDACGLPGPVIMQWVPRTWVDGRGWMFTAEQLRAAVEIAEDYRRTRAANGPLREHDPADDDVIVCGGCGAVAAAGDAARAGWLYTVEPDCSVHADPTGREYCPACLVPCPTCRATAGVCEDCFGAKRIPKSTDHPWDRP
jgi:hypothetical protein